MRPCLSILRTALLALPASPATHRLTVGMPLQSRLGRTCAKSPTSRCCSPRTPLPGRCLCPPRGHRPEWYPGGLGHALSVHQVGTLTHWPIVAEVQRPYHLVSKSKLPEVFGQILPKPVGIVPRNDNPMNVPTSALPPLSLVFVVAADQQHCAG